MPYRTQSKVDEPVVIEVESSDCIATVYYLDVDNKVVTQTKEFLGKPIAISSTTYRNNHGSDYFEEWFATFFSSKERGFIRLDYDLIIAADRVLKITNKIIPKKETFTFKKET